MQIPVSVVSLGERKMLCALLQRVPRLANPRSWAHPLSAYREGLTYHYVLSAEQGKSVSLPFGEVKPQGGSMVMRIAELRKSECCPVIKADRGCVAFMEPHYLAGNGAHFSVVLKLENVCRTNE